MDRTQFTFYESFAKAILRIKKKADKADAYDAIVAYALYGIMPDLDAMSPIAAIVFEGAKPNLDASRQKASNGKLGGSKRGANREQNESKIENKNKIKSNSLKEIEKEKMGKVDDAGEWPGDCPAQSDATWVGGVPREDKPSKPIRHRYGQYSNVLLSDEELDRLKSEFPDWQGRLERLSEYIASTGKSYKNHLATIRAWAKKDVQAAGGTKPIQKVQHHEDELTQLEKDAVQRLLRRQQEERENGTVV